MLSATIKKQQMNQQIFYKPLEK